MAPTLLSDDTLKDIIFLKITPLDAFLIRCCSAHCTVLFGLMSTWVAGSQKPLAPVMALGQMASGKPD
ncbi:hypothetical protein NDU88_007529 [Pleurodeles waltl]|uniref:Uncharacterized protein n=1 Tax=Pleurodeles waltl TaxID=8319 RepID=A0AAV7U0A8_PLEWA|nr:hypothetical protein NDU88_007529 [Pleurodeles waltl]